MNNTVTVALAQLDLVVGDVLDWRHVAELPVMLPRPVADGRSVRIVAVMARFVDDR